MKKPKKSKKFEYNLATVLKVRNIFEKIEKEKFAQKEREHREQLQKEEEMKNYQSQMQRQLAEKLQGEISTDFASIMHRHEYLKKYKVDVAEQEEKTMEAEQKKEEQRERLIKAVKDRKILDKDKDNKRKQWKKIMNKEETKFLDDLSVSRYFRQKKDSAGSLK